MKTKNRLICPIAPWGGPTLFSMEPGVTQRQKASTGVTHSLTRKMKEKEQ